MSTSSSSQQITPELRQWIVAQAEAGHSVEAVLQSMLASGWTEEIAVEAMETTLRNHLEQQALKEGLPPALPVPEPALQESPLYVDAGDRQVHVLLAMYNPRVVVFGNLLSDEECDQLIELSRPRMARSLTVTTDTAITAAMHTMRSIEARHLPVVAEGRLVGMVSFDDLFWYLARQLMDLAAVVDAARRAPEPFHSVTQARPLGG